MTGSDADRAEHAKYMREYRIRNLGKMKAIDARKYRTHKVAISARAKARYRANAAARILKVAEYAEKNKPKIKAYQKSYRARNWETLKPKIAARMRDRRRKDIKFRMLSHLRRRVSRALKGSQKKDTTVNLLGCSVASFKLYLESKFESGMTWDNYGLGGWEIDHIMPCAIFDLSKPEHQKRCFHFSNMQPLWASDNRSKQDTITTNQFNLL